MVVDDHAAIRVVMCKILALCGYSVVAEAADGVEAIEKYKRFRPKLTIMDVAMPHKNGIDATKEIITINSSAKVVMCTSIDYHGVSLAAEGAGASGIIFKPFMYEQVHEILDSVMEG